VDWKASLIGGRRRHRIRRFRTGIVNKEAVQKLNQVFQGCWTRLVASADNHDGLIQGLASNIPTSNWLQHGTGSFALVSSAEMPPN
jgi:hypothetical protein